MGGVTLPAHAPTLVVSLNDLANPDSSRPTRVIAGTPSHTGRVDQVGLWDLTGSEVRIRAEGGGRIDPALTGEGDSAQNGLPRSVAARIHLDAGLLEGAIPSQETYREEVFEFKSGGSESSVRQALTDTIQWTLQTGAAATPEGAAIVIDITPVGGGQAKRLLLAPSATPHRIFISNLPAENPSHEDAQHAMSDEEMGALHFGVYYGLLLNEPTDKPLPQLWRPVGGRKGSGFVRPLICPPAMFSRQ